MKKLNVKRSIVIVTLIAVVLLIASNVYATGTVSPINIISTTPQTNEVTTNQTTNEATNVVAPTTNAEVSTYTNTNLPQTGDASDYAVFLLIAVSIVIAVYAYKKVRDYNI